MCFKVRYDFMVNWEGVISSPSLLEARSENRFLIQDIVGKILTITPLFFMLNAQWLCLEDTYRFSF